MLRFNFASLCLGSFALLAALPGCSDRKPQEDATAGDSSSSDASSTEPPTPTGGMTMDSTGPDTPTTTAGSQSGSESGGDPTTTTATTGEACADPEGQPNDAVCKDTSNCGCASEKCFIVPFFNGFCGECLVDADCDGGGCSVPNPIAMKGSTCNKGEPGAGCETSDVCSDPANGICGKLLDVPGIITVSTCGQCASNADCVDPALANCTPTYDVENFSGQYVCVADASVPQDGGCNLEPDAMDNPIGNKACMSGFCGTADVMGILFLGVCGECNSDDDCKAMGKQTCTAAVVDLNAAALVGSVCM